MFSLFHRTASFADLHFVSENHCHLLPKVDDGVQHMADTVQILRDMHSVGIRHVTFTPHINPDIYKTTEQTMRERYASMLESLPQDIMADMHFHLGAEYMVTDGFDERDPQELLQFRKDEVLIEMSYMYESKNMSQTIFNIIMSGLTPVIAHPERYLYLATNVQQFDTWHDMGARFQLNLLSLRGTYGPASIRIMEHLLNYNLYYIAGSDTHTVQHFQSISSMQFPKRYLEQLSFIANN